MIAPLLLSAALASPPPQPPPVELTLIETRLLRRGSTVYRHIREEGRERGASFTLVDATPAEIWPHVLDVDAYVSFLPYVTASRDVSQHQEGAQVVSDSTLEFTTRGITTHYDLQHRWLPGVDTVAFTMSPVGRSPMRGSTGWWQAEPWAEDPTKTLLSYHVDVELAWWIPRKYRRTSAIYGLSVITDLVGRQAEPSP